MTEQVFFHLNQFEAASQLVKKYHYAHRLSVFYSTVGTWHLAGGMFGDSGNAVAACIFGQPTARWSESNILELTRLVRCEEIPLPPLTSLIASTVYCIKKDKTTDLLVSFADIGHNHHGGVYQAASWYYTGTRGKRLDGCTYEGEFIPARTMYEIWGTHSITRILDRGIPIVPHYDIGKHLYWKPLTKLGKQKADRLGLAQLPYPKPQGDPNFVPLRVPLRIKPLESIVPVDSKQLPFL